MVSNRVHDEDVRRWNRTVSEEEAVSYALAAGYEAPCLPETETSRAPPTGPCLDAAEYMALLPPDSCNAMSKHWSRLSRHEALVLEGQERLRYVQARVKEMNARRPPPQPAPPPQPSVGAKDKKPQGPHVTRVPVRDPSCWASCFGLNPLPPPPLLPAPRPVVIPLPPPAFFREAAAARLGATRPPSVAADDGGDSPSGALTDGAHDAAQPVPAPADGVSDIAAAPDGPTRPLARQRQPRAEATGGSDGGDGGAALPGQLPATSTAAAAERTAPELPGLGRMGEELADPARGPSGRTMQAPWLPNPPGALQSLTQPLPAGRGKAAGSGPRKVGLPPMRGPASAREPAAAASEKPANAAPPPAAPGSSPALDLGRYSDPESLARITRIQAAQRGRLARKQVAALRTQAALPHTGALEARAARPAPAPQPVAGPRAPPAAEPDPVLERYRDPDSLRKVVAVQAAQRGRMARREVAARRAALGQQPNVAQP